MLIVSTLYTLRLLFTGYFTVLSLASSQALPAVTANGCVIG